MNRPYVNLNSENIIEKLLQALEEELSKFKAIEGIIGITLNGGLARGYADKFSEIDIVIYLDKNHYEEWQKGNSPIPLGIVKINGYLYDIKTMVLEDEKVNSWDNISLWDLSYCKVLFDPKKEIVQFIKNKLVNRPKTLDAQGPMWNAWWYYKLAGNIWINREDILQGNFIFGKAVTSIIEALFVVNGEYIPHEKWVVHMSRTLNWIPENWEQRLAKAMSTGDFTVQDLINRQAAIDSIWKEINLYIVNKEFPDYKLNITQKWYHDLLEFMVEKEVVTVEEWETKASLETLNSDPFYRIVNVDSEKIILDKDKFLSIDENDMYSWHYEILEEVRSKII